MYGSWSRSVQNSQCTINCGECNVQNVSWAPKRSTKNVQSMMYNEECPMKTVFCAIKTVECTQSRVQWMYNFNYSIMYYTCRMSNATFVECTLHTIDNLKCKRLRDLLGPLYKYTPQSILQHFLVVACFFPTLSWSCHKKKQKKPSLNEAAWRTRQRCFDLVKIQHLFAKNVSKVFFGWFFS